MRRIHLLILLCLNMALFLCGAYLFYADHIPSAEIVSIKDEYLKCIKEEDDSAIAACLTAFANAAYEQFSIEVISQEIDALPLSSKNRWCHEMFHYMGWRAFDVEGDIAEAFLNSSDLCDSGMYHGVVEQYLRKHGLENIEEIVRTTCEASLLSHPDLSAGVLGLCYHGLGHGLMYVTSSDLGRSLQYCDALEESSAQQCYSGVFMEYASSKAMGPLDNHRDLTDFSYCETLSDKHKAICYWRQGQDNFSATNGDVEKAMQLCLEVPPEHRSGCFEGVGTNNPAPSKLHADAGKACLSAQGVSREAYEACIRGSLSFVFALERGDSTGALQFCSALPAEDALYCARMAGVASLTWVASTHTREDMCKVFTTEAQQQACLQVN